MHKEDKEGVIINDPEDGNDHAMDALLYGFMGIRPKQEVEIPEYIPVNFMTQ
jgi:phage terminase large subunit